jgi:phosphoribosyl 1,2-cyclic phosphate phosphodiesterase
MKIRILGTCAAEGWPALFCNCQACQKARNLGGKNIRTRCSLQFDDLLKIDLPPDSLVHTYKYNLELHKLRYLLITHSHADHLNVGELEYLIEPFAVPPVLNSLKIFANKNSIDIIKDSINSQVSNHSGLLNQIHSFQEINLPPYKVTTIKAMHKPDEESLNYIVEKDNKRVLYTCDTGFYDQPSWDFLKEKKVDLVICECTEGPNRVDYKYHMGFPDVLDFRRKAEKIGLTNSSTVWVLTHFSHGGGLLHNELEELVKPEGFEVAWDGMEIEM